MNTATYALTFAATASLLVPAASAEFLGIQTKLIQVDIPEFGPADVWRVYAVMDNANDAVFAVYGDPVGNNLLITTDGTFYQDPLGGDVDHPLAVESFSPVRYDTYLTIGSMDSATHGQTSLTPGWVGFGPSSLSLTNGDWYRIPDDPATDGVPHYDTYRVILGQFTVQRGATLDGLINLVARFDDVPQLMTHIEFTASSGDVYPDGEVNILDLMHVVDRWGDSCETGEPCDGDATGDASVDVSDVVRVITDWTSP